MEIGIGLFCFPYCFLLDEKDFVRSRIIDQIEVGEMADVEIEKVGAERLSSVSRRRVSSTAETFPFNLTGSCIAHNKCHI